MEGWIRIHRKLSDNPLWTCEKFTRGQAWVDLLILANHKDGYIFLRDHRVTVKRGQVGYSMARLATRWKWSRKKVKRFLNDLEMEQQIKQHVSHSTSVITIINYNKYQDSAQQLAQQEEQQIAQQEEQQNTQQKNNRRTTGEQQKNNWGSTNNNDKNEKKKKSIKEKPTPPPFEEFKSYAKEKKPKVDLQALRFKYEAWIENDWCDGYDKPIRNWKTKLLNTLPHIKEANNEPQQKHPSMVPHLTKKIENTAQ